MPAALSRSASDSVAVADAATRNPQSRARTALDVPLLGGQNRCFNPSLENNANSWAWFTYVGGSVVNSAGRITSDAFRGAACLEINFTAGSTPQVEANCVLEPTDLLTAGTIIYCRIAVKITGPLTANSQMQGMLRGTKASDGSFLFETQHGGLGSLGIVKPPVSGQWYEMFGTVIVPTNTGAIEVSCFVSNLTNGQTYTLHVDGGFACISPSVDTFFPYNDGSSTGWRWTGTAGNSTSRSTVPDLAATSPINLPRTGTDTTTVSDANTVTRGLPRPASDSQAVSDTATRAAQSRSRSASDTDAVSDAATRVTAPGRSAGDATSESDAATRITGPSRSAGDTTGEGDAATRVVGLGTTASDAASENDAATRVAGLARIGTDTDAVSDAATRVAGLGRSAGDTTSESDAAVRVVGLSIAASDAASESDTATGAVRLGRSADDTDTLSDAASHGFVNAQRAGVDTLAVADNARRLVVLRRAGLDSLPASDSASARYVLRVFESVSVGDEAVRGLLALWRAASDDVGASEHARRRVGLGALASDSTAVADAVTRVVGLLRSGSDLVAVFDVAGSIMHLLPRFPVMIGSNATPSVPLLGYVRAGRPMVASADRAVVMEGGLAIVEVP